MNAEYIRALEENDEIGYAYYKKTQLQKTVRELEEEAKSLSDAEKAILELWFIESAWFTLKAHGPRVKSGLTPEELADAVESENMAMLLSIEVDKLRKEVKNNASYNNDIIGANSEEDKDKDEDKKEKEEEEEEEEFEDASDTDEDEDEVEDEINEDEFLDTLSFAPFFSRTPDENPVDVMLREKISEDMVMRIRTEIASIPGLVGKEADSSTDEFYIDLLDRLKKSEQLNREDIEKILVNMMSEYNRGRWAMFGPNKGDGPKLTPKDITDILTRVFSKTDFFGDISSSIEQKLDDLISNSDLKKKTREWRSDICSDVVRKIKDATTTLEETIDNYNRLNKKLKLNNLSKLNKMIQLTKDYNEASDLMRDEMDYDEEDLIIIA
jgi:hypothetical protein